MAPRLPAEAYAIDRYELADLCHYRDHKNLGGLTVNGDELVQATGWDPDAPDGGLVIPQGAEDCVVMHADHVTGARQLQSDLVLAGTYVALHEQLREREYVVGVTFEPMARLAVRAAGFSTIQPLSGAAESYQERLQRRYNSMQIARRVPFKLAMVYMPTQEFVEAFSAKRYGTSSTRLLRTLEEIY